jgi:dUTP pyrophosphatase
MPKAPGKSATSTVKVLVLTHGIGLPLPAYQTAGAAGLDLAAAVPETKPLKLRRGGFALVPTGLTFEIPAGFEAQVRPRSGLAAKHGVTVLNAPGTIDSDYRGEVLVILINHGPKAVVIRRGDRIAQLIFAPVTRATLTETAAVSISTRGTSGFGSTGLQKSGQKPAIQTPAKKRATKSKAKTPTVKTVVAKATTAKPFPRRRIAPVRPGRA